jgi:hypothetical protein
MKLTISRTIEQKGIFKKKVVSYLNVDLELTSEEMTLLKRSNKFWKVVHVGDGKFCDGSWPTVNLGDVVGKRTRWGFESLDRLECFEGQLIRRMKSLKQDFEAFAIRERQQIEDTKRLKQQAADFIPEGPHEVEL